MMMIFVAIRSFTVLLIGFFLQIFKCLVEIFVAITQPTGVLIELFLQIFSFLVEIFEAIRQPKKYFSDYSM